MRILSAQLDPIIGDFPGNFEKILSAIKRARAGGADIVLFSELSLTGYPPQDFLFQKSFVSALDGYLEEIVAKTEGLVVVLGVPRLNESQRGKHFFNSAAVIENGVLLGYQDKILLPTYDVFDERRYFEPGEKSNIWNLKGKRIGISICEDIWQHSDFLRYTSYERDPVKDFALQGIDLFLNLSASPFSFSKKEKREDACKKVAQTLKCPVLLCNQVGGNDSLIFDGYSLFTLPSGALQHAKGFVEDDFWVDTENSLLQSPSESCAIEDLYRALVLGVRSYFHKQGFKKACLGISGGIDSALVACIAVEALGNENILGVLMPSRYSSKESITDALELAKNLKIATKQISIEKPFETYLNLLEPDFAHLAPDVTEENIQARIRGMILMALSNKLGLIVLSTGNKSEMAMGYSTLYGDLCGGLAVISDVTKGLVYALSEWINRSEEIIPKNSIQKPPSAELKPDQKDSDSLPDYSIIDAVIQDYLEDYLSPEEIAKKRGFDQNLVFNLIKKIHANEYKRRQSPLGLRVSEKSFSIGRSFPIVQKFIK